MDELRTLHKDKAFRAQFDIVTARAAARMQVLSELTIPYLKVGDSLLSRPAMLQKKKNPKSLSFVGRKPNTPQILL